MKTLTVYRIWRDSMGGAGWNEPRIAYTDKGLAEQEARNLNDHVSQCGKVHKYADAEVLRGGRVILGETIYNLCTNVSPATHSDMMEEAAIAGARAIMAGDGSDMKSALPKLLEAMYDGLFDKHGQVIENYEEHIKKLRIEL